MDLLNVNEEKKNFSEQMLIRSQIENEILPILKRLNKG
jgi:hypothetical protein